MPFVNDKREKKLLYTLFNFCIINPKKILFYSYDHYIIICYICFIYSYLQLILIK